MPDRKLRLSLPGRAWTAVLTTTFAGSVLGLALSCILLVVAGYRVGPALSALLDGAFGGAQECIDTLVNATPLFMTALATLVAYRARIWTVGQEGQLVLGAIFCYGASLLCAGFPQPLAWILPLLAGALGGVAWSLPPAFARVKWSVNEIVSTMMLNYVAVFLLMYLLGHLWSESSATYVQSSLVSDRVHLPQLNAEGTLNAGIIVAIGLAIMVSVMLHRSTFGFELRSFGFNPRTSLFKGINPATTCIKVFAISGAISGVCGAVQILGSDWRLTLTIASGVGYSGIMVAMLGRLSPVGAMLAALFFGALNTGSAAMQLEAGVPSTIARAMQAILLICFLLTEAVGQTYVARRGSDA
ncbi:hypothetical protein R69888_03559 [Paraburkholderia haematera]|uniref:Nucleoside ABC transporter membrane protein n=1 Tax=Paraburkholderia haematera TaxID=2793077 RepID=A0ABN7LWI2_9BURK|nr:hypothetical protein R69888_03559 [Paraburkholderia haematera]